MAITLAAILGDFLGIIVIQHKFKGGEGSHQNPSPCTSKGVVFC